VTSPLQGIRGDLTDVKLDKYFKADFFCFDKIIMEIKSKTFLLKIDEQQTINYIKAANLPVGLLVNFGEKSLRWKRFANTKTNS
jgi:GxxExxY protein